LVAGVAVRSAVQALRSTVPMNAKILSSHNWTPPLASLTSIASRMRCVSLEKMASCSPAEIVAACSALNVMSIWLVKQRTACKEIHHSTVGILAVLPSDAAKSVTPTWDLTIHEHEAWMEPQRFSEYVLA